jgi:hypothetical protein
MPILFNSVSTFVESVGRRRSIKHWNELDQVEMIYTGPTATVESWIPQVGAKNPYYPTMSCDGSETIAEVAGVTTLRTTYLGKFYGMGAPSVGSSEHPGEISWTTFDAVNVFISTPAGTDSNGDPTPAVYAFEFVSYTWLCRYIITTAIYKTLSRTPTATIGGGGGSVRTLSQFRTGRVSTNNGAGMIIAELTFPVVLIDSSVNPLNNGWFEITSTWGPQPQIITTLQDQETPNLTALNFPTS